VPPGAVPPVRVAVLGDWAAGTAAERAVAQRMCAVRRARTFDVVVTTGDNFYNPDGTATQGNYFSPERCLLAAPAVRWRAVWGNHDVAGLSTGTILGARSRWYSWTLGGAEFFMLDSNQPGNEQQRAWLENALRSSAAVVKIAVFHHPAYTAGLHTNNEGVRRAWVGLFKRYGVALVLSGHNHDYEHSRVDGLDYVVSGGGGASLYPCVSSPAYLITCKVVHHFLVLELRGRAIDLSAMSAGGETIDHFSIAR
jgi:tartrate-resistant acid phosphatase type 5